MPRKSAFTSSPSNSLVTSRKSSSCTLKCPMMLGAHISLGHGSSQVHRSLTHTWHLRAPPTSTNRPSEPFSLTFGVTYPILEDISNDLFLTFTHISRRNPYLDTEAEAEGSMRSVLILPVSYYPFIAFLLANPGVSAQGYGYGLGHGHLGVYPCPSLVATIQGKKTGLDWTLNHYSFVCVLTLTCSLLVFELSS